MKLKDARNKYILSTKLYLEEGKKEGEFVELREPNLKEINSISKMQEDGKLDEASELFADCLINHSFEDDDGNKAACADVVSFLKESGGLYLSLITRWIESEPFQQRLQKERK